MDSEGIGEVHGEAAASTSHNTNTHQQQLQRNAMFQIIDHWLSHCDKELRVAKLLRLTLKSKQRKLLKTGKALTPTLAEDLKDSATKMAELNDFRRLARQRLAVLHKWKGWSQFVSVDHQHCTSTPPPFHCPDRDLVGVPAAVLAPRWYFLNKAAKLLEKDSEPRPATGHKEPVTISYWQPWAAVKVDTTKRRREACTGCKVCEVEDFLKRSRCMKYSASGPVGSNPWTCVITPKGVTLKKRGARGNAHKEVWRSWSEPTAGEAERPGDMKLRQMGFHISNQAKKTIFLTNLQVIEGKMFWVERLLSNSPFLRITHWFRLNQATTPEQLCNNITRSPDRAICLAIPSLYKDSNEKVPIIYGHQDFRSKPLRNLASFMKLHERGGVISQCDKRTGKCLHATVYPLCAYTKDFLRRVAEVTQTTPLLQNEDDKDDHLVLVYHTEGYRGSTCILPGHQDHPQ